MSDALDGVRRVLAVRLDNIGDVVMLGPALRAVRAARPDAHVALLASPAGATVAPLLPWVDDVLVERALWQDASGAMPFDPARELALVDRLRARRFDAALLFTSFAQSPHPPAYACYLAGIPVRVGESKEFGGSVLSHWVPPSGDEVHQVDRNLRLAEAAGAPSQGPHLELRVPPDVQRRADAALATTLGGVRPFAVLAPGASAPARRWPPERFGALARLLADELGLAAVTVGSARDGALVEAVAAAAGGVRVADLAGATSVPELAGVVRRAALVVTNNSGSMHLADALRRPVVVPFAGTELEGQWAPRSSAAALLRRPTTCAPCYGFDCPYDLECLDLAPEDLLDAARRVLAGDAAATGTAQAADDRRTALDDPGRTVVCAPSEC